MNHSYVVVISGITGGGKTTLIKHLRKQFKESKVISFDDYSIDQLPSAPPIDTPVKEAVNQYDINLLMTDFLKIYGKTQEITSQRFVDLGFNSLIANSDKQVEEDLPELGYQTDENNVEMYFITEEIGYRLPIIDAATGSRWYGLEQTTDSGENWQTINSDPFDGRSGISSGIKFFDEELGFIILGNTSQTEATLFRTEDGGENFQQIDFPSILVPLNDETEYNPFQFPQAPYVEDGDMFIHVGQGIEGDYNSGVNALYQSEDGGLTWEFIDEVD